MVTVGAVRITTLVICAAGIAGMIVTSILNHNGAAVTFGLVTAVAIVCSMVAKAVANTTEQQVLARVAAVPAGPDAGAGNATPPGAAGGEPLAEDVERQVQAIVAGGADEAQVRRLVGASVALGRELAGASRDKRAAR